LKDGLSEYNDENKTDYKIVDTVVQGSIAMSTTTQNDSNDYDIDVAIIFDKDNIPEGTTATKNLVVAAIKKKCSQFYKEPEFKTNCVRIYYQSGYHIDFAIYRRYKDEDGNYKYEHCGSEWRPRDPRAITKWFMDENKLKDYRLIKVVRLCKMFCKSRENWRMPGGLIQTVLVNECYEHNDRSDVMFYNILTAIKNRLKENDDNDEVREVKNPVDQNLSLLMILPDYLCEYHCYLAQNILFVDLTSSHLIYYL
jgi:hypothetical protein